MYFNYYIVLGGSINKLLNELTMFMRNYNTVTNNVNNLDQTGEVCVSLTS